MHLSISSEIIVRGQSSGLLHYFPGFLIFNFRHCLARDILAEHYFIQLNYLILDEVNSTLLLRQQQQEILV